jgi:hypothetical protein
VLFDASSKNLEIGLARGVCFCHIDGRGSGQAREVPLCPRRAPRASHNYLRKIFCIPYNLLSFVGVVPEGLRSTRCLTLKTAKRAIWKENILKFFVAPNSGRTRSSLERKPNPTSKNESNSSRATKKGAASSAPTFTLFFLTLSPSRPRALLFVAQFAQGFGIFTPVGNHLHL